MIDSRNFFKEAEKSIEKLKATQVENIEKAAKMLTERMLNNGVVHIFGTGHSKCFAMELVNRAGGLVPMNKIVLDDLALKGIIPSVDLKDPSFERNPNNARKLWELYNIQKNDAFIIVSNSGRNGSIVEFASIVKEKAMPLIVVTSMEHTRSIDSRHPSGKKLYELGDVVIDNCGPVGDALMPVADMKIKACSISSITGAFIAQALTAEIVKGYLEKGETPPILISYNVDNADEHNDKLLKKYEGRI
ncbi:SIS domain-containing protein [Wukongibacter baidiensis]|uniref:sugar isomerase domain-containing protein n=1 Tax=Wukongibacter baidiensis TaxID=1723361 RepID=UPI003D7FBA1F